MVKYIHIGCTANNRYLLTSQFYKSIYSNLFDLNLVYPCFQEWFVAKVIPGAKYGSREFILSISKNHELTGIAILKNDVSNDEKKICTIKVMPNFLNAGVGIKLFERSMEILNTDKPLATVSSERILQFNKIFKYFGYKFYEKYEGLYLPNSTEYSFNGYLDTQRNSCQLSPSFDSFASLNLR
jgi:hypothetical protein